MPLYGRLDVFDAALESWNQYTQRMRYYFRANNITENERQVVILLTACGPRTFGVIRSITYPAAPDTKTFDELVNIVGQHFNPTPSTIVQRYWFNTAESDKTQFSLPVSLASIKVEMDLQEDFEAKLKQAGGQLVVLDFFAEWCGLCKTIAPKFEEFAIKYTHVIFYKVDVGAAGDVAEKCNIAFLPTFVFFKNGQQVGKSIGRNENKLETMIKTLQ